MFNVIVNRFNFTMHDCLKYEITYKGHKIHIFPDVNGDKDTIFGVRL